MAYDGLNSLSFDKKKKSNASSGNVINDRTSMHMAKTNFDVGWGVMSMKDDK